MPENNPDTELYWLIGIVAAFFLILLLFGLVSFINDFSQELRYLNNEIRRTDGAERRHYIRQRRRLWLSLIPFVKYWSTYNRVFLCGERGNKMCLVFVYFTSRRPIPRKWDRRQSKSITILLLTLWLVTYIVVLFDCWKAMNFGKKATMQKGE